MSRRKYSWRVRSPEKPEDNPDEESFATSVLETIWDWIKDIANGLAEILKDIWDFLFPKNDEAESGQRRVGSGPYSSGGRLSGESAWVGVLRYAVFIAVGAIAVLLCVVVWRKIKLAETKDANAEDPDAAAIDLENEDVTADELPESGWLEMARKLAGQGDSRLALRAMYLASLAMLAENGRISIARFKSNLDYRRELARRSHAVPQLLEAFGLNVRAFEAVWYGTRQATEEIVNTFIDNQKTIGQIVENA